MSVALQRIETLYAGPVGEAYAKRNRGVGERRLPFWRKIDDLLDYEVESVLEIGCGEGENLAWWSASFEQPVGLDVSATALRRLPEKAQGVVGSANALPFQDSAFDLVISAGLMMHVPEPDLPRVMDEAVRVAKRWLVVVEYEDTYLREIPWHGLRDVLWARPVSYQLWQRHPRLKPLDRGSLTKSEGFDRMDWSLWSK